MASPAKLFCVLAVASLLSATVPRGAVAQRITIDGRLSAAQTLVGPNYAIGANLGKQVGSNLFHSFGQFGLATTESAAFSGPATVSNIIGRVTGGNPSSIDGRIQSNISGANLYLINPSGIVFGPNATVNVTGSFHASTADYLRMSDGSRFQATNPDASTLTAAQPVAFGFLNAQPAAITVNGSGANPTNVFGVPTGQTLGLVAGPVTITGGTLRAPAGTVNVTGVAGSGEVPVDPRNTAALTVTSFGPVNIKSNGSTRSTVTASNTATSGSGGSVFVLSGALTIDTSTIAANNNGSVPGGQIVLRGDNQVTLSNNAMLQAFANGSGSGAGVTISTAPSGVIVVDGSTVASLAASNATNAGPGGTISIIGGQLALHNGANVLAGSCAATGAAACDGAGASGAGGAITVSVGSLKIDSRAELATVARGSGNAGNISVIVSGPVAIDIGATTSLVDGIGSLAQSRGNAGNVTLSAGALNLSRNGLVSSQSAPGAVGDSGSVSVNVSGMLSIDGSGGNSGIPTGIRGTTFSSGRGGDVTVTAGRITIAGGACALGGGTCSGVISSDVGQFASGAGGNVTVAAGSINIAGSGRITTNTFGTSNSGRLVVSVADELTIDGAATPGFATTGMFSQANSGSTGNAGSISVNARSISIVNSGTISAGTFGPGNGGSVSVNVAGGLMIDGAMAPGSFTGISSQANQGSTGNAGPLSVTAGSISIANAGQISSLTFGPRNAGQITAAAGTLSIVSNGAVMSSTLGSGRGGGVSVTVAGQLVIDGTLGNPDGLTGVSSQTQGQGSGDAGTVTVAAGAILMARNSQISSNTFGSGKGGSVSVMVDGGLRIDGTAAAANSLTGIATNSEFGSTANAGDVAVTARTLSVVNGGAISSSAIRADLNFPASTGNAGTVAVNVSGPLSMTGSRARIATETQVGTTGDAGSVAVTAPQITITSGAEITSATAGTGMGGSVKVTTSGALVLDGAGVANTQIAASATGPRSGPGGSVTVGAKALTIEGGAQIASSTAGPGKGGDVAVTVANGVTLSGIGPSGASGVTASAQPGSTGQAGEVVLTAGGAIALSGGAEVATSTAGAGDGGTVRVTAQGPLTLTDPGSGIIASATSTASGNAGSVTVGAPLIALMTGAEIASTTAGTGAGGSVVVTTPGTLVLDGAGVANTQIAASATGPQSGPGGSVTVGANALTIEGGAQIASSTAGPGRGGDVTVTVASDIALPDPGPQITARSTGSGDAGSITVSAIRLLMNNGAAISTEAATSTASGGNITLHVRDFLYLVSSEISTSVKGETGNGGNIAIDPQLVILDHSSIIAQAIEGHGGDITITAGQFIPSSDSIVSASSELGISGTIVINGPRVDVNGALVVLSSQLRGRTEVLREACAARAGQPISSLVEAGRGGLPQDPEATLPALYIAGRDVNPEPGTDTVEPSDGTPLHTTARLTMRCS